MRAIVPIVLLCPFAGADVGDWNWFLTNTGGGSASFNQFEMSITGGNAGVAGVTQFSAEVCHTGGVEFTIEYTPTDGGQWDYCYFAINGAETIIADNTQPGVYSVALTVTAGDIVAIGVATLDGFGGPGYAEVTDMRGIAYIDDFAGFCDFYLTAQNGSGFGQLPPPILHVVGGDAGIEDFTDIVTLSQVPFDAFAAGKYFSTDIEDYDIGYHLNTALPNLLEGFIDNATQGPFAYGFASPGGSFQEPAVWGFGVYTADGEFGPGVLTVNALTIDAAAARIDHFAWFADPGPGGALTANPPYALEIIGGNNGTAGLTAVVVDALHPLCIEADFTYTSSDTGPYDQAVFILNGEETIIADNASQGTHQARAYVCCGDVFGFGVRTLDGQHGAGTLQIDRFRAWALTECATDCYADCDGSGAIDLFDFLCFLNNFSSGSPEADCDRNGLLDVFDYLCFLNAYFTGCP